MAVLLIIFVVLISVAIFFFIAAKLGGAKDEVADVLDLDALSRSREKETESLLRGDDDQYV